MHLKEHVTVAITAIILAGCSSNDLIVKKQMETDTRLDQLVQSNSAQSLRIAEISRELQELKSTVLTQESTVNSVKSGQKSLKEDIETVKAGVHLLSQTTRPATIEVVNSEPAKIDKETSQQEAYMKAFGLFSSNRYNEAAAAFSAFIAANPESEFASNAQYWMGECFYSQKDFIKAVDSFNTVLVRYPKGNKVPDAMLKIAYSQFSLNDQAAASKTLQKLIETHPKSPAAQKARERLNRK